jgi:hypothetical protein
MTREVIVLPGGAYGPYAPLLMYAADAAEARGASIRHVDYRHEPGADPGPWVLEKLGPVTGSPLLIAKSLGTHAAEVAARQNLPGIWLTPVLTSDWVVDALRRATAPMLLVGGTGDKLWDGALARELSPHVFEVDGADHGMYVPGRLAASAAVLGQVATAVEDFLDQVIWP